MKLLALYVICGFLAMNNVIVQSLDVRSRRSGSGSSSDESSDYGDDVFGAGLKGIREMLQSTLDGDDSQYNDKDDDNDNDSREDIEIILDSVNSLFGGTLRKLEEIGKGAVEEFLVGLRDLVEVFIDSQEMEQNTSPAVIGPPVLEIDSENAENSHTIEETVNDGKKDKTEKTEKDRNKSAGSGGQPEIMETDKNGSSAKEKLSTNNKSKSQEDEKMDKESEEKDT